MKSDDIDPAQPTGNHLPNYSSFLRKNVSIRDDGRFDLKVDSSLVKSLSVLLPDLKPSIDDTTIPTDPPPYSYEDPNSFESAPFPIKLNIVIQVVGSRGDVQPFVALGCELQKHGHRVRLATHDVFKDFVRSSGLEFFPVGGDPAELMAFMVANPGLIPSMKSLRAGDVQKKRKMVKEMLDGFWRSCIHPNPETQAPFVADAIIANPPSFAHISCAQALSIPLHLMFTMPWTSTRHFPHPLANIMRKSDSGPKPQTANYVSYGIVEFLTWQGLGDVINDWRNTIDLEPVVFSDGPRLAETLKIPFTYCWSPALVPKPSDWASHIDVCGFFFREPPNYTPPPALDAFLRNGPPPVYIGFGSIVIDNPERMTSILIEAVARSGVRALISRGWSKLGGSDTDNIMYLDDCPHEWLFRRVAAVVHHGGAGTTACGLLNGRPTTIVPFFGDQPFWGDMIAAAGAGPKPIPQKSLNAENLVAAIRFCLQPDVVEATQRISDRMRTESGVKAAVASFHTNLPLKELECDVIKGEAASWVYKGNDCLIKLSKTAAGILSNHLKVDYKKLKMYQVRPIAIETKRWDPMTGTLSAAAGVSRDLLQATADVVIKPVKAYRKEPTDRQPNPEDMQIALPSPSSEQSHQAPIKKQGQRICGGGVGSAAKASASSVRDLAGHYASGAVVIPYAFTEGLRNVPHLYGDKVRDYGEIRDWKSGTIVGAKVLTYGVVDGVTDVFMHPYMGAKEGGAAGAAKGVFKGLAGITSKVFTATMGVATYPLYGMYKSAWTVVKSSTQRAVKQAKHEESEFLTKQALAAGIDRKAVMEAFDTRKYM